MPGSQNKRWPPARARRARGIDAAVYLAGGAAGAAAQSCRLLPGSAADPALSMMCRSPARAPAYLGAVIADAETWRLQIFGSKGWVELGDVEHLHTWTMNACFIDPNDVMKKQRPEVLSFPKASTEHAELENFARAAMARRPIAIPGGDEVHNVAVLDAIVRSPRA